MLATIIERAAKLKAERAAPTTDEPTKTRNGTKNTKSSAKRRRTQRASSSRETVKTSKATVARAGLSRRSAAAATSTLHTA